MPISPKIINGDKSKSCEKNLSSRYTIGTCNVDNEKSLYAPSLLQIPISDNSKSFGSQSSNEDSSGISNAQLIMTITDDKSFTTSKNSQSQSCVSSAGYSQNYCDLRLPITGRSTSDIIFFSIFCFNNLPKYYLDPINIVNSQNIAFDSKLLTPTVIVSKSLNVSKNDDNKLNNQSICYPPHIGGSEKQGKHLSIVTRLYGKF